MGRDPSAYRETRTKDAAAAFSVQDTAAALAELRAIEKDINDMCELMEELRDMVEKNGELMDQIEAWVAQDLEQVTVCAQYRTVVSLFCHCEAQSLSPCKVADHERGGADILARTQNL